MANTTVNPIQVQKYLADVSYPASKEDLLQAAELQGAEEEVMDALRRMPMDTFNSPNDVAESIGRMEGGEAAFG